MSSLRQPVDAAGVAALSHDLVEQADDIIFIAEASGQIVFLNAVGRRLLAATACPPNLIALVPPERQASATAVLARAVAEDAPVQVTLPVTTSVGTRLMLETNLRRTRPAGEACLVQGIARDVTARMQWEVRMARRAMRDALTGLPNRAVLLERLAQAIVAARRAEATVACLLLDLDQFAAVNDAIGQAGGDALLRQIVPRLTPLLRDADTLARLGGDEFALLLPDADAAGATLVAVRLLHALVAPFIIGDRTLRVSASIGIAVWPTQADDADSLLRRATAALRAAKRTHGGYALYSPERDQAVHNSATLTAELHEAITGDQFALHYQPQVHMTSGVVARVEALVRWNHPRLGLLGPDHFVALAEESGQARALSQWVLTAALRDCRAWHAAGFRLHVSVNLSPHDLSDPWLAETVLAVLAAHEVEPSQLTLELTESSLVAHPEQAIQTVTALTEHGVRLAVDDYGTGYSSLALLRQLPVSELKIDKSFVLRMAVNDRDATIVRSTIEMGHQLGIEIVAEGVEDRATWRLLDALACDLAQGYCVSRPLPGEQLLAWLATPTWSRQPAGTVPLSSCRLPE
jgi:diguanylate cyclase (GGDEF)-like protein/PAS domain S-box-containing protein